MTADGMSTVPPGAPANPRDAVIRGQAVIRSQREADHTAAETKGGFEECQRAAYMAAWTRKHGKNDDENPHSRRQNAPCGLAEPKP